MAAARSAVAAAVVAGALTAPGVGYAEDTPCRRHIDEQLALWSVVPPALPRPSTDGVKTRYWPTHAIGTWVVETVEERDASLTRVGPDTISVVRWSGSCQSTATTHDRVHAAGSRFTDADLQALLRESRRGAIYVWSPHMPLSVDGVATLQEAARLAELDVTVVLHSAADRDFARRTATARGWPVTTLRIADSVELQFRDALVHAPTALLYSAGRLIGTAFPGYHTAPEYLTRFDRLDPR